MALHVTFEPSENASCPRLRSAKQSGSMSARQVYGRNEQLRQRVSSFAAMKPTSSKATQEWRDICQPADEVYTGGTRLLLAIETCAMRHVLWDMCYETWMKMSMWACSLFIKRWNYDPASPHIPPPRPVQRRLGKLVSIDHWRYRSRKAVSGVFSPLDDFSLPIKLTQ